MKTKTFDCVEEKRKAQAKLMEEYERQKNEYPSFAAFVRAHAKASPRIQTLRKKLGVA